MRRKPSNRAHVGNAYAGMQAEVIALQIRDGNEAMVCPYCERPMEIPARGERTNPKQRTVEHIVPQTEGGTDRLDNLVLCCRGCNTKRGRL